MNMHQIRKNVYIKNFAKDKRLIAAVLFIVMFWSGIYLMAFYSPKYKSKAKILIKDTSTQSFVTNLNTESDVQSLTSAGNPILNQMEILKSEQLSVYLYDYLKKHYPQQAQTVKKPEYLLEKIMNIKNKPATDVLEVTLGWQDPKVSQELLNAALGEYQNLNLSLNRQIRAHRREYIDKNLAGIEKKLYAIREKIRAFKTGSLAIDLDEESKILVDQKSDFKARYENVSAQTISAGATVSELESQLSMKAGDAIKAVALGSDNKNLVDLRTKLDEASQQYAFDSIKNAKTNPKMIAQKARIDAIKSQIQHHITLTLGKSGHSSVNIFDPVRTKMVTDLASAKTNLMSLNAEKNSLSSTISKIEKEQQLIPVKKNALDNLQQEENNLSVAYDELRKKQIEAEIKEAESVSNVVVVDKPNLPDDESFPKPSHVVMLAFVLGSMFGMAASALKTLIEDICEGAESIKDVTQSPIIGVVPWLKSPVPDEKGRFIYKLSYENILSSFLIKCYKSNARVISVTSSSMKKYSSKALYSLAKALAKQGNRVAIVDTDMRIPVLHSDASVTDRIQTELSDLILSVESKIQHKEDVSAENILGSMVQDENGISILANRNPVSEPYEYFGTSAFVTVLQTLRESYDWVLVDTPPAAVSPEFLIISRLTDGIVLLTNITATRSILKKISERIREADIPLIGTIIREKSSDLERRYSEYMNHRDITFRRVRIDLPEKSNSGMESGIH